MELYNHTSYIQFDIAIDGTNQTKQEITASCNEFFGTENATFETMLEIDTIFANVLEISFDPDEIYEIIEGPDSFLRDGLTALNCTDASQFEIVKLGINMSILSGIRSTEQFNLL